MPNRTITEAICVSKIIDSLTAEEERLLTRLKVHCDDYGRFFGQAAVIIGRCFPGLLEDGTVTVQDVERWLQGLHAKGAIHLYHYDDQRYLQYEPRIWEQNPRAKTSKHPDPPGSAPAPGSAPPVSHGSADLPATVVPAPEAAASAKASTQAGADPDGELDGWAAIIACQEYYRGGAVVRESDKRKVRQALEEAEKVGVRYGALLSVMKDLQLRAQQADPPFTIGSIGYYSDAWREKIAELAAENRPRAGGVPAFAQQAFGAIAPNGARAEPRPLTTDDIQ